MGCRIGAGSAVRPNPAKFTAVPRVAGNFVPECPAIPSQWENETAQGAGLFYTPRQSRSPIASGSRFHQNLTCNSKFCSFHTPPSRSGSLLPNRSPPPSPTTSQQPAVTVSSHQHSPNNQNAIRNPFAISGAIGEHPAIEYRTRAGPKSHKNSGQCPRPPDQHTNQPRRAHRTSSSPITRC